MKTSWENTSKEFMHSYFLLLLSIFLASTGKRNKKPGKLVPIEMENLQKILKGLKRPGDNNKVSAALNFLSYMLI